MPGPPNPRSKVLAPYYSDAEGLVYGYHFVPGEPATPVSASQARDWLRRPDQDPGFLWLHFALTTSGTSLWIKENLDLPEPILETLFGGDASPRIDQHEGIVQVILKDVVFDFAFGLSEIATLHGVLTPLLFVTFRSKPLRTVEHLRQDVRRGEGFASSMELLVRLLRHQADVLETIQREASAKVDSMEDTLLANRPTPARSELGTLRRVLVRLQRLLAPEPAVLSRLLNKPPAWIRADDLVELRHSMEEFSTVLGDLHQLNERIKLLQEELGMRETEKTNRNLFTLTLVTVLAVPFNVVGGLFGMNVGGVPWSQDPAGFGIVVTLVVVIGVAAALWLRRL